MLDPVSSGRAYTTQSLVDIEEPDLAALTEVEGFVDPPAVEFQDVNFDVGSQISLDDSVKLYLREIGQVELLDAAREIELASAMERGNYAAEESGSWSTISAANPTQRSLPAQSISHSGLAGTMSKRWFRRSTVECCRQRGKRRLSSCFQ